MIIYTFIVLWLLGLLTIILIIKVITPGNKVIKTRYNQYGIGGVLPNGQNHMPLL